MRWIQVISSINFTRITQYLDRGFLLNLMVKKCQLSILLLNIYYLSHKLTKLMIEKYDHRIFLV